MRTETKTTVFLCLVCFLVCLLACLQKGYPDDDTKLYSYGIYSARHNQIDFAFSYFDFIVKNYPESKVYEKALFATGEYFFLFWDYRNAEYAFKKMIEDFPQSEFKLFSLAYLLRTAKMENDKIRIKELEREIVKTRQVSLLFREFKEYTLTSPLHREYKAAFFIDKVEIFINGELFEKVPF